MRYRLIVPAYVEAQIDACIAYIVQTLHNPDAARNVLDELAKTYERLSCLPEAAPLCRDAYLRGKNYRIITISSFIGWRSVSSTSSDSFTCVKIIGINCNIDKEPPSHRLV